MFHRELFFLEPDFHAIYAARAKGKGEGKGEAVNNLLIGRAPLPVASGSHVRPTWFYVFVMLTSLPTPSSVFRDAGNCASV